MPDSGVPNLTVLIEYLYHQWLSLINSNNNQFAQRHWTVSQTFQSLWSMPVSLLLCFIWPWSKSPGCTQKHKYTLVYTQKDNLITKAWLARSGSSNCLRGMEDVNQQICQTVHLPQQPQRMMGVVMMLMWVATAEKTKASGPYPLHQTCISTPVQICCHVHLFRAEAAIDLLAWYLALVYTPVHARD